MKRKREKLICDVVAEANGEYIRGIGKIATPQDVTEYVAPEIMENLMREGCPSDEIAKRAEMIAFLPKNIEMYTAIAAINNFWWGGRQVYRFDDALSELLIGQTKEDLNFSPAVFESLPVDHFFVLRDTVDSEGFFFSMIEEMIYIADCTKDAGIVSYILPMYKGKMISEIIESVLEKEMGEELTEMLVVKSNISEISRRTAQFLQFAVYLCAINAEVEPVTRGAVVRREAQRKYTPRDKTEISEVGYKIGAAIRQKAQKEKVVYVGEHSKGSKKSPHIRRSHFHSFWTKSGDGKKLIVKYINTIFVNGGDSESSTLHDVK